MEQEQNEFALALARQLRERHQQITAWDDQCLVEDPELLTESLVGAVVKRAWLGREIRGGRSLGLELEQASRSGAVRRFWVVTPVDDPERLRASGLLVKSPQRANQ